MPKQISGGRKLPSKKDIKQPLYKLDLSGHRSAIKITNLRGIRSVAVNDLQRINLFAGMNALGKTTMLEGIFLLAGVCNPHLPMMINALRGLQSFEAHVEGMFGHLFHWGDIDNPIEIEAERGTETETLRIKITPIGQPMAIEADSVSSQQVTGSATTAAGIGQLVLSYKNTLGGEVTATAVPVSNELKISVEPEIPLGKHQRGSFLTSGVSGSSDDASRYSKLAEIGQVEDILPTLQIVEPRLKSLQVLSSGGKSNLYADLGGKRLLPLYFCGGGLTRLTNILLTISDVRSGGVALVDEFENGLHYSVMQKVWEGVAEFCRKCDTQLFTTTHSWECIAAAQKAFDGTELYDFRLHRLDRRNGHVTCTTYDRESLRTAVESQIEVR